MNENLQKSAISKSVALKSESTCGREKKNKNLKALSLDFEVVVQNQPFIRNCNIFAL